MTEEEKKAVVEGQLRIAREQIKIAKALCGSTYPGDELTCIKALIDAVSQLWTAVRFMADASGSEALQE